MSDERIANLSVFLNPQQAAIYSGDSNRVYLTGFSSSAGTVIVTKKKSYFLIDFRYYEKAKHIVTSCEVVLCEKLYEQIFDILKKHNIKTLFVETGLISIEKYNFYKCNFDGIEISDNNVMYEKILELRSIKSLTELENIKRAQKLTDDTFNYILNRISTGRTEKDIMLDMEFFMRKNGSEGVSFDFIVVSGKNSSLPHGVPTDKKIQTGDFVTMDFGAVINGYRSDMTRTVAVEKVSEQQQLVYNTVLNAQLKSISVIKPGVLCCEVDRAARDIISNAGYTKCFGHALGHSVGIDIHESPACSPKSKSTLKEGMIMTVEPGIYIENTFGVRIEDMVFVTKNGCLDITNSKKELTIV